MGALAPKPPLKAARLSKWLAAHAGVIGADTRSLAAFRILLGVYLLVDLVLRAPDLAAHYSDAGVLPRAALPPFARLTLPLHRLGGAAAYEGALFAVAALAAAALLVGYRTRIATIVSWLLLLSLHERNHTVLDGGDPLMRILLFWSMFAPLGARWSLDRKSGRTSLPDDRPAVSFGVFGLLLQTVSMFFFTGVLKAFVEPWRKGTALHLALAAYHMTTSLGDAMMQYPGLLRATTYSVLVFEILGPLLFFSPWKTGPVRTLAAFGFLALMGGIDVCMRIGTFPEISMVAVVPLLPAWFWDRLLPALGLGRVGAAIAKRVPWLAGGPVPATKPAAWERQVDRWAGAMTLYILAGNVWQCFGGQGMPLRAERLAYALGIDQYWAMFCVPARPTGWTVIPAELENGESVDLLTGRTPVQWEQPAARGAFYANSHWRGFIVRHIWFTRGKKDRPYYAAWLCRQWNGAHDGPQRIRSLELVWMRQNTQDDATLAEPKHMSLWKGPCP